MKEFPRIHSLSTLGLIHHQEFDYEFHPLRTDFMGDSGSGKSMIGDLLQLIFVGSNAFESATVGTDDRKPTGMVLEYKKGRGTDFAYAFANIAVTQNKFVVIGTYIETTVRNTHSFIIESGYEMENLTPFDRPLSYQDFLKNDEILPIDLLKEYLEKSGFICNSWQKPKSYHEILFKNKILPLDLTSNDKTLKDFAQIIQSFSRGKTLDTKKSTSLKDFLFGDTEAKEITKRFKEAVKEFESEIGEYGRNLKEINRVTEKQKAYLELHKRRDQLENSMHEWLIKSCAYFSQEEKDLYQKLVADSNQYIKTTQFLAQINNWANSELSETDLRERQLKVNEDSALIKLREIEKKHSILKEAQEVLSKVKCESSELKGLYKDSKEAANKIKAIESVKSALKQENLEEFFESQTWPNFFQEFSQDINNKLEIINEDIKKKRILKNYSDINDENSLANWAFNLDRPLTFEEESALIHFQYLPRTKPSNKKKYLPRPEELILALNILEREKDGFWLNINGILEFVPLIEERVFDQSDKKSIKFFFAEYSKELQSDIDRLIDHTNKLKLVQSTFLVLDSPKQFYEYYLEKAKIDKANYHKVLDFDDETLEKYLSSLSNEKVIEEEYGNAQDNHREAARAFAAFENQNKELKKIKEISSLTVPTSEEARTIFERLGDRSSKAFNSENDKENLQNLIERIASQKESIRNLDPVLLYNSYKNAISEKEKAFERYKNRFSTDPDLSILENIVHDEPRYEHDQYLIAEKGYQDQFSLIVNQYLSADSHKFETSQDFLELGKNLLPEAFRNEQVTEENVIEKIRHYLERINEKNRELSSRKIQRIRDIVEEINDKVTIQLNEIRLINNFFKSDEKQITGGYRVRLKKETSKQFPLEWIATFKDQVDREIGLFASEDGLRHDLSLQIGLEEMMKDAFDKCGGSKDTKVTITDLLNPCSYFDLTFSMESDAGRTNIGSTGQTYAAIAMLCIARLSIIGKEDGEKQKPGIRFMPIDEAEGLGSNYDLLYNIAKTYDYQIISMSVGSVGRFKDGDQYVYILHKNSDEDDPVNFTPMAIYSRSDIKDES
ncbi:hypothetical protein [Ekhidna sp.]|uniref:hypothetical protein n=1 Tax=Ekhidna sp. TaxID=2608089 RepID=UPI0032996BFE